MVPNHAKRHHSPFQILVILAAAAVGCGGQPDGTVGPLSISCPTPVPAWTPGTAYATGAVVSYNGTVYQCRQGHTALDNWTPSAVPALWLEAVCTSGGGTGGGTGGGNPGGGTGGGSTGGSCNATQWKAGTPYHTGDIVLYNGKYYVATHDNPGYDPTISTWFWSPTTCGGGNGGGGGTGGGGNGGGGGGGAGGGGGGGGGGGTGGGTGVPGSFVFSAYKDTSINMDWNTNVITTNVTGTRTALVNDLTANGGKAVTLAFATGECGSENWGGVPGAAMAAANLPLLKQSGVKYILSTGGAAGSFSCGSDAGMATFINRWASSGLIGIDFDIEAGQSQQVISDLIQRIKAAHAAFPNLRFSLTLATLANNSGASTAVSLGGSAPDSFNYYGDLTMNAVKSTLGFNGSASTWPSYVTVALMTMDYGAPSPGVCVVSGGNCQMGQSALQAAYNLHDHWGVPFSGIELTPMIGGNDTAGETFTLSDADLVAQFAISKGLAGVHYWSYDRDVDCPAGAASPTCNSMGGAGAHGFLKRFMAAGLR
jgi:chitinase